jgi:hypothetical protein
MEKCGNRESAHFALKKEGSCWNAAEDRFPFSIPCKKQLNHSKK